MTPEEMKALFTEVLAPVTQTVTKLTDDLKAMGAKVDEFTKPVQVTQIEPLKVLAQADVDAAVKTALEASDKKLADTVKDLETKLADVKAAAVKTSQAPERKTLPPAISNLLARSGASVGEDGKVAVGALDKAMTEAGMNTTQRLTLKTALERNGQLT